MCCSTASLFDWVSWRTSLSTGQWIYNRNQSGTPRNPSKTAWNANKMLWNASEISLKLTWVPVKTSKPSETFWNAWEFLETPLIAPCNSSESLWIPLKPFWNAPNHSDTPWSALKRLWTLPWNHREAHLRAYAAPSYPSETSWNTLKPLKCLWNTSETSVKPLWNLLKLHVALLRFPLFHSTTEIFTKVTLTPTKLSP